MAFDLKMRFKMSCSEVADYPLEWRNDTTGYEWEKIDYPFWQCLGSKYFNLVPVMGVIYLALIYFGQQYMKNRKPFEVRGHLVKWNLFLAAFSILCVMRTLPDFVYHLQTYGVHDTMCTRLPVSPYSMFWKTAFVVSKIFELFDTVFLIVMKKPVLFIHWFHHFSIMLSSFYVGPKAEMVPGMSLVMNASVHSIMYTYFAIHVAGYRLPRFIAMIITSVQLTQFFCIWSGTMYASILRWTGQPCDISDGSIKFYMTLFTIYIYLFGSLFYNNYFKKFQKKHAAKSD